MVALASPRPFLYGRGVIANSSLASVRLVAGGLLYDQCGCNSDSVKISLYLARNAFGSQVE
jgi:hypothetical protein